MTQSAWMECRYCNGLFSSAADFIRHQCNRAPLVPYQLTDKDRIFLSVLNIKSE